MIIFVAGSIIAPHVFLQILQGTGKRHSQHRNIYRNAFIQRGKEKQIFVCTYLHKTEFANPMIPMSSNVLIPQLKTPQNKVIHGNGNQPMFQSCSQWALLNTANMASVSDSSEGEVDTKRIYLKKEETTAGECFSRVDSVWSIYK